VILSVFFRLKYLLVDLSVNIKKNFFGSVQLIYTAFGIGEKIKFFSLLHSSVHDRKTINIINILFLLNFY